MFTGLIAEQGIVKEIRRNQQMIQLTFQASNSILSDYNIGDSMAVNGVCLTAIEVSSTFFKAEIMPETFKRTTFSTVKVGYRVTVTRLIKKVENQNALVLTFAYPTKYAGEIIPQGSIAINGVSLTVMETTTASFSVSLIPNSKSLTNLGNLSVGHFVNIETDMVGKYVKAQRNKFEMYKEKDLL